MMRTAIIFTLLSAISFEAGAVATERTMIKQKDEVTGDTRICTYSGGGNTEVITVDSSDHCSYTETFEVD